MADQSNLNRNAAVPDKGRRGDADTAIVGMSCKLPGGIETPNQLWHVLATNQDVIGSFPRTRRDWPAGADYPGIDRGGFVHDADAFDAAFFRISPAEARIIDPQQRMLLELAWACLEDAGIVAAGLKGSNTGVFVGASNCDYSRLVQDAGLEVEAHHGVGSSLAVLANRVSYFFGLSGPSLVIDTACSSSLVALHSAIQSLRSGECSSALVAGVNLICHPDLSIAYHKAGMLAPDGRCKVFDAKADGYVRSEGAVAFLLRPLRTAIAEDDQIHAVIRGSAINHGAWRSPRTTAVRAASSSAGGLTVPDPQKQKELLIAAWKDAAIAAQDLSYVEAHGTGTAVGDPIEIHALQAASAEFASTEPGQPCAIGSLKSNLGHLESAAGIAGLLKVVLCLQQQQLPGSINFTKLNPKIRLENTPFYIADRLSDWQPERPRVAAVSSFGSGGTNAHVVVQEHVRGAADRRREHDHLFVLSTPSEDRLRAHVSGVIDWLGQEPAGVKFGDAIFTWQVGRTAMEHRLAIKVTDHEDLLAKLKLWLAGSPDLPDVWSGRAVPNESGTDRVSPMKSRRQLIDQAGLDRDFDLLGRLWVSGVEIDWNKCYESAGEGRPRRISVPTYPFAKDRYWIEQPARRQRPASEKAAPVLHPLLHINSSDLSSQRYSATFGGDEFFLSDHQVRADGRDIQKVLPAVAYLEMARVAIEHALPARSDATVLELRNVVWAQPIVVAEKKNVSIALLADDQDQIDYEIYGDDEIVHCQGRGVWSRQSAPPALDLQRLEGRMAQGHLAPDSVYTACARMGLVYGPAFQAISSIHQGNSELLARMRLPKTVADTLEAYVLHPSLMDGALQAALVLIVDPSSISNQPRLPFALESLRVLSPCTAEMVAWVRYSAGSHGADRVVKLDIDLCDERGNVCVQMHGFSSRIPNIESDAAPRKEMGSLLATRVWHASSVEVPAGAKRDYTQHHIVLCEPSTVQIEDLAALLPNSQILPLHASRECNFAQRYSDYALWCFERIRTILQGKPQGVVLVQIVVADHQEHVLLAGLSGLLKTAALENPILTGQILLVSRSTTTRELAEQLQDEKSGGRDPLVRYQEGVRQVLRWQEIPADQDRLPVAFRDDGVYLISGGLGGLGVLFANEILARTRDARVVLTGRSALSAETRAWLDALSAQAGRVRYRQVDLADLDEVKQLITAIKDEHGRLNGILHGAGMIADNFILKKAGSEFIQVLAPKVIGTFSLDEASRDENLDWFVLFSSYAGAFGNVGQSDYAAANGFMDQFAAYRNGQVAANQRHGRTRSINWPLWRNGGMEIDPTSRELLQEATGMQPMQTVTGMDAFHRSLALPYSQTLVMEGDLVRIRALLSGFAPPAEAPAEQPALAAGISMEDFAEKTRDYLRRRVADVLQLPSSKIDPRAALERYGIDSILAMKLTNHLEKSFGSLSKTLFFEYQSIHELAEYFIAHHATRLNALLAPAANVDREAVPLVLAPSSPAATVQISSRRFRRPRAAAQDTKTDADPIAIIGLSGRYPGAIDIHEYWNNLRDGKDSITEVPAERWDWRAHYSEDRSSSGRHYSKWGGFIAGVDEFDPQFFGIAPREAKYIDPQERLFLQHAWMAIEDAGYTRTALQVACEQDLAGQVGVYVGVMWSEYQLLAAEANPEDGRMGFAGNMASLANRVSYAFNLHGPSVTLDTMCSSSMTAIHYACQDLKLGRTTMAIAGGVNVSVHPNKYLMLSVGQFISSDGHCQSFGDGGDGYIPGEGVGAVVLKRLSAATRDGDHVYGIIRGSALTHGGRTNGYTVPNPQAQAGAISRALAEAQIDARHISYIEAHGTGTKLGDPIEIAALNRAFKQHTQDTGFCLIGSAKSNIGHCESAAGIAGLTKVLLQMQHRQIVPSLHSERLNPHIDFAETPFVVNQSLRPWDPVVIDGRKLPRIAGISSFGAGGSNAHLLVEEHEPVRLPVAPTSVVVVLSARTAEQLRQKVRDLLRFVRPLVSTIDLMAMAWTLQVGREAMDERLGIVVSSADQLVRKLEAYVDGEQDVEDLYQGEVKRNREALSVFGSDADLQMTIDKWMASRKLSKLLELWVKGLDLDWSKLYGEVTPSRMSLPTYPFARERHWIDTKAVRPAATSATSTAGVNTAILHPLVHSNISDLSEQRYSSTFTGEELFVTGNGQPGHKMLLGAACLEMARAAVEHAMPARSSSTVLELRNVVWGRPIIVSEKRQVGIALLVNEGDEIDYEIYSQDADQQLVHCQGHAAKSHRSAPATLDLIALASQMRPGHVEPGRTITGIHQADNQLLAWLRLQNAAASTPGDYVLHPALIEGALQAAAGLIQSSSERSVLFALDSLRILSNCSHEMVAWARYAPGNVVNGRAVKVDLDLCDERGNIAVQIRGVTWQAVTMPVIEPVIELVAQSVPRAVPAARNEIAFLPDRQAGSAPVERKGLATISLAAPRASLPASAAPSAGRGPIALSNTTVKSAAPHVSSVRLHDDGNGIFSIEIGAAPAGQAIGDLRLALQRVQLESSLKVLQLSGVERGFGRGGRQDDNEAVAQELYRALASFPYPIIASLQRDAIGAAFLAAALCDVIVCEEDATYGYTDVQTHLYPTTAEMMLFAERFGEVLAQDFLYVSAAATGKQLRTRGWTCPIVPAAQIDSRVWELASAMASKSQDALRLLRQHQTRRLVGLVEALRPLAVAAPAADEPSAGAVIVSPSTSIRLDTTIENVLVIKIGVGDTSDLLAGLDDLFGRIRRSLDYKAVVLASEDQDFLQGVSEDVVEGLSHHIVESRIPVVTALEGNARDNAWLFAQFSDAVVYSRQGLYSAANIGQKAAAVFAHRFGHEAANEILLTGADYSGADLEQRVGTAIVAEREGVLAAAVKVADLWTKLPRATLASWKEYAASSLQEKIRRLPAGHSEPHDEPSDLPAAAPIEIPLRSTVVKATAYAEGVVLLQLEDRQAKNMFSNSFVDGIREAFAYIERSADYKVVVLTGYDTYFSSGPTREILLDIQAGKINFTDFNIFQLPLDCKLPVIAAMQGHGIGAGWTLGLFADLMLLSEESQYESRYMNYGFTPGAGSTWILAEKIGRDLATEGLFTAHSYTGSELKDRGLKLPILPRKEVVPAAMELARQIAQRSRRHLINLKQQLTAYVREPLEETYRLELAMHEKTFVGRADILAHVEAKFQQDAAAAQPAIPQQIAPEPAGTHVGGDALPAVTAALRTLLANELQMPEVDIDDHAKFVDLGLDSISGVTWVRKINARYQTSIEATKIYSFPTMAELSRHVRAEAEKSGTLSSPGAMAVAVPASIAPPRNAMIAAEPAVQELTSWRNRTASRFASASAPRVADGISESIAVIGMAGQFPQARNLDEFWQNIAQGRDCITEVPANRWDVNAHYRPGGAVADKTNSRWIGALEDYDLFDPLFFNISPKEAESIDPQQRLFLQACWHSIEDAGYDARSLSGSKCGVFAGCTYGDYHLLSAEQQRSGQGFTGESPSILSARISYLLNLQGPCVSIDTACSSSLVALAQACDSLASRASDVALAGGVWVMTGPEMHIRASQMGMLSSAGRCFTFDQRADGFVPGEGVGVVLLKRLADAERDRDIIHAVIQGWGVNHDGKTNGITAPNPESQARLQQDVYDKFQIDPGKIQLLEAHGTGTKLGDPIEVEALKTSFRKYTAKKHYCALGSVKSNIGHCLWSAGVAGVLKLVMALKHKQLPPTINFECINEHVDLTESPFYVSRRLEEWKPGGAERRQAAISSFGLSGTNAHMVISEYLPPAVAEPPATFVAQPARIIVPLSARRPEQLEQKARDLLEFLRKEGPSVDLLQMAYTLQVGREAMDERLGFLVSSVEQLAEKLEAYVAGGPDIADVHRGQVRRSKESMSIINQDADMRETMVTKWIGTGRFSNLLDLWVKGLDLDWSRLYGAVKPSRITLPLYPFARERYWIEATTKVQAVAKGAVTAVLHPFVHRNTSDLSEQRYSSTFTGEEFFLTDHQVKTVGQAAQRVFPGVACLEMARAAIEQALPATPEANVLELHDTVWMQPIVVGRNKQISIALSANDSGSDGEIDYEIYSQDADEEIVHCQGRAAWSVPCAPARLDLAQLEAQMRQGKVEPDGLYAVCARMGLVYGPSFRSIAGILRGSGQLLAQLRLPASMKDTSPDYVLHPSLMDGALQASVALIDGWSEGAAPRLPFALESLRIVSPCTSEMVAWVRYAPGSQAEDHVVKLDIDLCDEQGRVCVQLKGFAARALAAALGQSRLRKSEESATPEGLVTLAPVWGVVQVQMGEVRPAVSDRVVVIGGDEEHHRGLWELCPDAEVLQVNERATVEEISDKLRGARRVDHVVWVLPRAKDRGGASEGFIQEQEEGVLLGFRLIKALLYEAYEAGELAWTIITNETQRIGGKHEQKVDPAHSSVYGLAGSMAKEYPNWKVRLVDVGREALPWDELLRLGWDERGDGWGYREGQWYRRQLVQCVLGDEAREVCGYKREGVYVVIGGAGGVGEVLSEHLIRKYDARVVWIGRRAMDESIEKKQARVAAGRGERPSYIVADARIREDLERVCREIKERYGRIDGVIHAAIVLADKSLANMSEEQFRAGLSAKVDVAVQLAQVFGREPLDFVLYFSSLQSFLKAPGQSNYAAGCTFTDAFAEWQSADVKHPVKVMNWGYWGSVGIVAGAEYQERMRQLGVGSIEPEEGMAGLERLLTGPLDQVGMIRMEGLEAARALGVTVEKERMWTAREKAPSVCERLAVVGEESPDRMRSWEEQRRAMDEALVRMLWAQMETMCKDGEWRGEEWTKTAGVAGEYQRWVDESLRILVRHGYLQDAAGTWKVARGKAIKEEEAPWTGWEREKSRWEEAGNGAQVKLVEATLRGLGEILRGEKRATDIMFPSSSLELVEGVYKHNAVADYFNGVMANVVGRYVEERREAGKRQGGLKLRLLELGAGTGGSSEGILRQLDRYPEEVEEYCYSDVSKWFLLHGEQAYGKGREYLRTAIVDVERALEEQGVERGVYDVVIAANVLHATRRVRETIRNAKAALKENGILVLNEIGAKSVYTHLTFGLLEGWWSYEDAELRMEGNPGLTAETWKRVLEEEGFRTVCFPAQEARGLAQQIIVAESDGIIRQKHAVKPQRRVSDVVPVIASRPHEAQGRLGLLEKVEQWLVEAVCLLLKVKSDDIDVDAELSEFGFDSISLTGFAKHVNEAWGLKLMPTVFFEHATLRRVAGHLMAEHAGEMAAKLEIGKADQGTEPRPEAPAAKESEESPEREGSARERRKRGRAQKSRKVAGRSRAEEAEPQESGTEAIAIIGMSGRFPGAEDLDAFWENLQAGKESIVEIPPERWDWRALYGDEREDGNKSSVKWGAFIDGVDEFDPLFFGISPREAELMDPQQRLLMMYGWKAIEDAGYGPGQLWGSRTGIFIGTAGTGYSELMQARTGIEGYSATGLVPSVGPNRLSYMLNLHGPSEPIETACSSSLVAVHRAVQTIVSGECDMALAGGVNTLLTPTAHISFSKAGMLSRDGKCKTFSSRADGYVRGEGVGIVVLKKLSAAVRDGDHIYGLIRGSAENHGGRGQSLTAPNPQAQAELIKDAYRRAGVSPGTVSYIEAHGTGTALGDPVEVNGLKSAFQKLFEETGEQARTGYCGLGSVKSNIGHLELAAGIAGLIKVVLQLKHRTLVPSLHCEEVNAYIQLEESPFYIVRDTQPWKRLKDEEGRERPLRAGVSAFGFGGVNAHVVVEEYAGTGRAGARSGAGSAQGPAVVVLSAKDEERLKERASQLRQAIGRQRFNDGDLADLAYTLQVGREAMEHRVAMTAGSMKELEEKLGAFVEGKNGVEGLYRGEAKRNSETLAVFRGDEELQEAVGKWLLRGKRSKVMELWVKGLEIDWAQLYGEKKPRRLSLPTYPFARERYWIDAKTERAGAAADPGTALLHPLLHQNTSDLRQQRYSSTFTGEESFLRDHRIRTNGRTAQRVLPAVAYLEMARAAIERASPQRAGSGILELRSTVWLKPVVADEHRQVSIALFAHRDDEVGFEIYGVEEGQETIHCQGQAFLNRPSTPSRLDLVKLADEMDHGGLDGPEVYATFAGMGLEYGPAHQGIVDIRMGEKQVLARLRLPAVVESSGHGYGLHPSLMDSALQASIGLMIGELKGVSGNPFVPFVLESVRIASACTKEMTAWVRYAEGSMPDERTFKLDIDLCDPDGNVCVQMRGLAMRAVGSEMESNHQRGAFDPSPARLPVKRHEPPFDHEFYRKLIAGIFDREVSVAEAVDIG
jgi:acyl transferase domain-containing protein/enoyl-CoA hydratase/carnithine racemase/acyl carrier protein/SAM-dependent methyltransferase